MTADRALCFLGRAPANGRGLVAIVAYLLGSCQSTPHVHESEAEIKVLGEGGRDHQNEAGMSLPRQACQYDEYVIQGCI
jgi:hypothetical protein